MLIGFTRTSAAFHWTGKDGGSAIKEIARVLKPGGTAVFIWNLESAAVADFCSFVVTDAWRHGRHGRHGFLSAPFNLT